MNTILKDLAAVSQPQTDIIGHLTWYGISEMLITRDELRGKLTAVGLDGFMPHEIRLPDAFRRATSDKHRKKVSDEVYENYLFREVSSDRQMIQRNIIVETVDGRGKRLNYDPIAATLVLDKLNATITISHTNVLAGQLALEAKSKFDIYRENYGSTTLRTVAMNIVKSMAPTPVRPSGGVYFIPERYTGRLDNLLQFLRSLDKAEGEKVPLINTRDMKGMITRKLHDHLRSTLNACEHGAASNLPKGQVKEILDEARRVVEDYKQYVSIVSGDMQEMEGLVVSIREKVAATLTNMAI